MAAAFPGGSGRSGRSGRRGEKRKRQRTGTPEPAKDDFAKMADIVVPGANVSLFFWFFIRQQILPPWRFFHRSFIVSGRGHLPQPRCPKHREPTEFPRDVSLPWVPPDLQPATKLQALEGQTSTREEGGILPEIRRQSVRPVPTRCKNYELDILILVCHPILMTPSATASFTTSLFSSCSPWIILNSRKTTSAGARLKTRRRSEWISRPDKSP